jgi:acyl-CoA thioesterase-1
MTANRQMSRFQISVAVVFAVSLGACSRAHEQSEEPRPASAAPERASTAPALPSPTASTDDRKVLAVFGDSLAAGYGLPQGKSFPDALQKKLDAAGYAWHVVNLGISGDTTEGGAARIDSATTLKPSIVILELGGNDGLRGMPLASTRQNLEQMIAAFQKAGAKVVLAGMSLPPNYGPDYIQGFEKIYKDLAAQYHAPLIPFLLSDIVTKDLRYFQPDGIHPTAPGAEIVAGTVLRTLEPLLGRPGHALDTAAPRQLRDMPQRPMPPARGPVVPQPR